VAVDGDVPAADVEDPRDDRGAVERRAPVLEGEVRLAGGEHADALEDRHPLLGVLRADAVGTAAALRSRQELAAQLHRLVVDRGGRGTVRRRTRRFGGERVVESIAGECLVHPS
jgi:hypothetical protein